MRKLRSIVFLWVVLLTSTSACDASPVMAPTAPPFPAPVSPTPLSDPAPWPTITPLPPDTGWEPAHPGIEVRSLDVAAGPSTERVTIARLDPAAVRFEVHYVRGAAYPMSAWARQLGAFLVVSGGYFTPERAVTGLTISEGIRYGHPYGDYAGMFAVTEDGVVSVRWLRTWPYDPSEPLSAAIQSFPVLIRPGGILGFPADGDDGRRSRRTVVAQDRAGRVLLLIAPRGHLSLHSLAVWLVGSDLDLDIALNLDGGTSAGFWMSDGPSIDSLVGVPVVLAVLPR